MTTQPKCAICSGEYFATVWEVPVCQPHWQQWSDEAPYPVEIEKRAKPEHIKGRTVCQYGPDIIELKDVVGSDGVTRSGLGDWLWKWTRAWAKRLAEASMRRTA